MHNKKILLARRPQGMVQAGDFSMVEEPLPDVKDGQLLVHNQFISLDPAMRGWMNEGTTYIKGVAIGEVMRAFSAGIVVESRHPQFTKGDAVQGLLGAQQYCISNGEGLVKVNASLAPLSWHLGLLGMPGLTAYFGLLDKGKPMPGETVLVSAAAGMIGSLVGQIAKIKGCTVIGIAGGPDKCKYLKEELGFDAAIDYKQTQVAADIKAAAPNGVHIYFDNVGGEILDAALLNLATGARVVICGAISQYNDAGFSGLKNYMKIVTARGTLTGIIVLDYFSRATEAVSHISQWVKEGKIKYREHVVNGLEHFTEALQMLFNGENQGKLILATSPS
jgi:NADPH-dependent curcumin reductase CurA